jgi:hypothetical protein
VNHYTWEISYRPRLREAELLREYQQSHQHPPRCNQPLAGDAVEETVARQRRAG